MVAKKSHDMILDRNHLKKRELDLTKNDDIKRRQHNSYTNRFKKIDSDMETKYHKVHKEKAMSSLGKDVTKVLDTHSLGITQALANTQTMSIAQTAGTTHIMGNNHK